MAAPIYDNLVKYTKKSNYPYHMPGHKQGRGLEFHEDFLKMDITEIEGFDNLHNAEGIIKEAEELCAVTFGADRSFFLVNGSSCGIEAAILTVCGENDKILVARNSHRSVYSGLIFSGAYPVYVMPDIVEYYGMSGGISVNEMKRVVKNNRDAKAVIIVSPTYEGFTSNIKEIAQIIHNNNMILIVDEAHGSHMKFSDELPLTALEQGADIVIQSIHKTLPSMTQSSLLHIKGTRVNISRLKTMLALVQSSSPSYVLMASIDKCRDDIDRFGNDRFEKYLNVLEKFRLEMGKLKIIKLVGRELCGQFGIDNIDIGKLVFYLGNSNITGMRLEKILLEKYHIQLEMSSLHYAVAMTSIADDEQGFEMLKKALFEIDDELKGYECTKKIDCKTSVSNSYNTVTTPRYATFAEKKKIDFQQSLGCISGEFIIPYPPGIPIIVPGEEITNGVINCVNEYFENGLEVVGMSDNLNRTILVLDKI